jgi:hypothetical protein
MYNLSFSGKVRRYTGDLETSKPHKSDSGEILFYSSLHNSKIKMNISTINDLAEIALNN